MWDELLPLIQFVVGIASVVNADCLELGAVDLVFFVRSVLEFFGGYCGEVKESICSFCS